MAAGGEWNREAIFRGETRRHEIPAAEILKEGPRHGYEIISGLESNSEATARGGSVYPTLQMLERAAI